MSVFDDVLLLTEGKGINDLIDFPVSKIEVRDWVFEKARYCDSKNNWAYPPFSGNPQTARKILKEYKKAFIFIGKSSDGFRESIISIESELIKSGFYKAFALIAGPCDLCVECPTDKCIQKNSLRPAIEAWGIDIVATIKRLKKNVLQDDVLPAIGLILLE